ncbi:MAG: TIGR02147 family protein, partial [Bdellovibrionales bacterium]|nr:TIGR02147 family protein [Bdellovibrionales bacterium]
TETASPSRELGEAFQSPVLSEYTDFRQFLSDFYEFKKKTLSSAVRPYSYAAFSASADIKSPNYLKLIIEGQRNLSMDMVKKFARALGLSKEEAREFKALVLYGQARDPLERNRYLKALSELRVKKQIRSGEINTEAWDKVPGWVSWVIYALADQRGVDFDPVQLRRTLRDRVSVDEIKRAIDLLLESGELKRNEEGEITKGRELVNGYESIPVAMVRKIQAELIYLGLESLFQDDPTEREVGALTMALTKEEFEKIKFEVRQLKKRLLKDIKVSRSQSKGERVYQLNIQLFPVSNTVGRDS